MLGLDKMFLIISRGLLHAKIKQKEPNSSVAYTTIQLGIEMLEKTVFFYREIQQSQRKAAIWRESHQPTSDMKERCMFRRGVMEKCKALRCVKLMLYLIIRKLFRFNSLKSHCKDEKILFDCFDTRKDISIWQIVCQNSKKIVFVYENPFTFTLLCCHHNVPVR